MKSWFCPLSLACDPIWDFLPLFWPCGMCSVMSDSLQPYGLQPVRLPCPLNFSGRSTGVGCHFLLQGSSLPRDQTCVYCVSCVSCTAGGFFTCWTISVSFWGDENVVEFDREDACTNLCVHYKSLYMCLVVKLCLTLSGLCGLQSARLLCPWYSPGKNIGVVAISFSRGSFQPRDWTCLSCIGNWVLYHWATREANCMLTRANFMVHEWYPNFLMEFSEKKLIN